MQLDFHKVVINLPERTERLFEFDKEFAKLFSDEYEVVMGVRKQPVHLGIAEAHLNCIRLAKENKWDKVLIMEDDLLIQSDKAKEYMESALKKAPKDWDILLGGIYWAKYLTPENKYWSEVGEFCALHWYLVHEKAYDKLLTYDGSNHYDRWVGLQPLKKYVVNKFFAIQKDGYSDNVNKITDYNSTYLRKFELLK